MLSIIKGAGWVLAAIAVLQVPIWAVYVVYKQKEGDTWFEVNLNC
jgi:hypothetical protein